MSNKFIYPDSYSQEDNGNILAGYGLCSNENFGVITSLDDTYDNFGLIENLSPKTTETDSYGLLRSTVIYYINNGTLYDPVLKIQIIDYVNISRKKFKLSSPINSLSIVNTKNKKVLKSIFESP